jgi:tetratricopeptide (TPR) repeat protein
VNCSYHPTVPGLWTCPQCHKTLCYKCVDQRAKAYSTNEVHYFCPKCNVMLDEPDISKVIAPFWQRLHMFFTYPFSAWQPLAMIAGTALLSLVAMSLGFLGLFGSLVLWAVMLKYAFEALRSSMNGDFKPPMLSDRVLSEDIHIVFKQLVLFFILIFVFLFFVAPLGLLPVVLFGIAVILLMPSMIIILVVNDSLLQAINPLYFFGMAARIGPAYLLMFFFLALLYGAPAALGSMFMKYLPPVAQVFFIAAAKNYYTLVSYHLMGYVMFQYHERLNYSVDKDAFLKNSAQQDQTNPGIPVAGGGAPVDSLAAQVLKEAKQLTQDGKLDEAIALIQKRMDLETLTDTALAEHYLKLLQIRKNNEALLKVAPQFLSMFVSGNNKQQATALYSTCASIDKDFVPSAMVLFKIGTWLNNEGKSKAAIGAFNKLIKKYPKDPLLLKTCFSAAQIFNEKLNNPAKAKQLLTSLLERYPHDDLAPFIKAYLNKL